MLHTICLITSIILTIILFPISMFYGFAFLLYEEGSYFYNEFVKDFKPQKVLSIILPLFVIDVICVIYIVVV